MVTWTSFGQDGDSEGVFAQRFAGPCGNGVIDGAEECDDGNLVGRDGCRSDCTIESCWICAGTPSVCAFDAVCAEDGGPCANVPLPGCRASTTDGKGSLRIKDRSPDAGDQLLWRWAKGEETLVEAFGDPLLTTDYAFCLYDRSASSEPRLEAAIAAGGTCAGRPCWKSRSDKVFEPTPLPLLRRRRRE